MKRHSNLGILLALAALALGCSGGSPAAPDIQRDIQTFDYDAIEIFGPSTAGEEITGNLFHDICLCQIRCVVPGLGSAQEIFPEHGCAAVTLVRRDDTTNYPFKPVFRWLDWNEQEGIGAGEDPLYVTARETDNCNNTADYRAPACAAIYDAGYGIVDPLGHQPAVELVVCYQVRNVEGLFNNADWDIGVTALQWIGEDAVNHFWEQEPACRYDIVVDDPQGDAQHDEFNPDIAYDHRDGAVYAVYSNVEDNASLQRIKYRKYYRVPNNYSAEFYAQTTDHNGHDPSIDTGYIDFTNPQSTEYMVAVAYTSQYKIPGPGPGTAPHYGFHVCATSWPSSAAPRSWPTAYDLMNWDYAYLDAGLPSLDISPNVLEPEYDNVAALVYTQVTGSDGYGPITWTFIVRFMGTLSAHVRVNENEELNEYDDALYPSVAINSQTGDPVFASVTHLAQTHQTDTLRPWAARMQINVDPPVPAWRDWVDQNALILGNYNISDIPFVDPGVASAIVTNAGNNYWAAWCNRTEMEPPPTAVYATRGVAGG